MEVDNELTPVDRLLMPVEVDVESELTPVERELMPVEVEVDSELTEPVLNFVFEA